MKGSETAKRTPGEKSESESKTVDLDVKVNHVADIYERKKYMSCDGVKYQKKSINDRESKILLLNRPFQH